MSLLCPDFIFTIFIVQAYKKSADKIYFHKKKSYIFISFLLT